MGLVADKVGVASKSCSEAIRMFGRDRPVVLADVAQQTLHSFQSKRIHPPAIGTLSLRFHRCEFPCENRPLSSQRRKDLTFDRENTLFDFGQPSPATTGRRFLLDQYEIRSPIIP